MKNRRCAREKFTFCEQSARKCILLTRRPLTPIPVKCPAAIVLIY
jgi:hypothetical protein